MPVSTAVLVQVQELGICTNDLDDSSPPVYRVVRISPLGHPIPTPDPETDYWAVVENFFDARYVELGGYPLFTDPKDAITEWGILQEVNG